jgi:hypothetical protein
MRKSHRWRRGSPSQEKKLGGPRPISFEITHTRACAIDLGMVARSPPTSPTSSDAGFRGVPAPTSFQPGAALLHGRHASSLESSRRTGTKACGRVVVAAMERKWRSGCRRRAGDGRAAPSGRGQWWIFQGWKPCGQRRVRAGGRSYHRWAFPPLNICMVEIYYKEDLMVRLGCVATTGGSRLFCFKQ